MCPFPHLSRQTEFTQNVVNNFNRPGAVGNRQLPLKRLFPVLPEFSLGDAYREGIANIMASSSRNNAGESAFPIGYAFLKLFVEHDLSYSLYHQLTSNHAATTSPSLDLVTLYGRNPQGQPYLFNADDSAKFLLIEDEQTGRLRHPRNEQNQPLLADPRNCKYPGLEELHILFCIFHNQVVDYLRAKGKRTEVFEEAQKLVRWHYHWLIINDLLPSICSDAAEDKIKHFHPDPRQLDNGINLPVEALLAAFRFDNPLLNGFENHRPDDWKDEFLFENNQPYYASSIKAFCQTLDLICDSFPLPQLIQDSHCKEMLRLGHQFGLPSGEAVSRVYGIEPLSKNQLGIIDLLRDIHQNSNFYEVSHFETPLWYYLLKEAEEQENGQRLGRIASYIFIETLQSILARDTSSYLMLYPTWQPYFSTTNTSFTMKDLVIFTEIEQKRKSA